MSSINVKEMAVESAREMFPPLAALLEAQGLLGPYGDGVAIHLPSGTHRALGAGVDTDVLLMVLPDRAGFQLDVLARCELNAFNEDSADLLTRESFLAIETNQLTVRMDLRSLPNFPEDQQFGEALHVGILCAGRFLLCRHQLGDDGMQSLMAALQGCCMNSGLNYNPWRIWSDQQLSAAAGLVDARPSGDVDVYVMSPRSLGI